MKAIVLKNNGKDVVYPLHIDQSTIKNIQLGQVKYGLIFMVKFKPYSTQIAKSVLRIGEYYPNKPHDNRFDQINVTPLIFDQQTLQSIYEGVGHEVLIKFIKNENALVTSFSLMLRKTVNPLHN